MIENTYKVKDDQNPKLKEARHIARTCWSENYRKLNIKKPTAEAPENTMRSYNTYSRILRDPSFYDSLHQIIFTTLANEQDPLETSSSEYYKPTSLFKGLYDELSSKFPAGSLEIECLQTPANLADLAAEAGEAEGPNAPEASDAAAAIAPRR
jgi:hypothetical protein